MAPNIKNLSAVAIDLSSLKVHTKRDALYTPPPTVSDPAYWDESATTTRPGTDLFSAGHIEENLINASVTHESPSQTLAENDSYWAEATSTVPVEQTKSPEEHDQYWDWSHKQTVSDMYWDEQRQSPSTSSDNYWSWSHKQTSSDAYWMQ